jgi:hypothetical protein
MPESLGSRLLLLLLLPQLLKLRELNERANMSGRYASSVQERVELSEPSE